MANFSLQRNIELYPRFMVAASFLPWMPVFFLYFSEITTLEGVIRLSALYYFAVFVIEVPSGYASDRFGRRLTLAIAALSFAAAYLCFLCARDFALLAAGQILLATGMAFMSGTDTAFHYDSLLGAGRETEYLPREAHAERLGSLSSAASCLAGGALAMIDFRLTYALALAGSLWMLWLVWHFVEPEHAAPNAAPRESFLRTIAACLGRLRDGLLAWLFLAVVVVYSLQHITYEFYQPYIRLLDFELLAGGRETAVLISGVVLAVSMYGGALGASVSVAWRNRLGLTGLVVAALLIQLGMVAIFALTLGLLGLSLILFRNFPMSLMHAPVNDAIAPRIGSGLRATYLSVQSLSARLLFAALLYGLSLGVASEETIRWPALSSILVDATWFGAGGVLLVIVTRPLFRYRDDEGRH